jgi:hypothetical protein
MLFEILGQTLAKTKCIELILPNVARFIQKQAVRIASPIVCGPVAGGGLARLTTGAYHEAMHPAGYALSTMCFAPDRDGIGRHPAGHTETSRLVSAAHAVTTLVFEGSE